MGEGCRIDHDGTGFLARLVNPVDDLVLGIALQEPRGQPQLRRQISAALLDIGQRFVTVDMGLAAAQRVQIGPLIT